jgi:hypothetical protein
MSSNLLRPSNFILAAFVLGMSVVGSGCGSDDDDDSTGGTGGSKGGSAGTAGKGGTAGSSAKGGTAGSSAKGGSAGSSAGKGGTAGKGGSAGSSAGGQNNAGDNAGGASGNDNGGGGAAPTMCSEFKNCCNDGIISYLNQNCAYINFAYCPGACRMEGECTTDLALADTPLVLCEGGDPNAGGAGGAAGSGN